MESAPLKDFEHLQLPKIRSSNFIVKHYAMNVSYDVTGFVAKNTDSVNEKLLSSVVDTKSVCIYLIIII
jgi:myosin heavy subunit